MTYRDILAPLFGDGDDATLPSAIEAMKIFSEAHVAAAVVGELPDPVVMGDALGGAIAIMSDQIAEVHKETHARQQRVRANLDRSSLAYEVRLAVGQAAALSDHFAMQARHVDLTVMGRLERAGGIQRDIFDSVLMESGRPVLLVPDGWQARRPATVFVAWNASREAARAVADAEPLLAGTKSIVVGTIDARASPRGHGEAPGVDIATHLARHGHSVELRNVADPEDDKASAIITQAMECGADLIVLGGFGHPRVQQAWFGGVTRTLIMTSPVPLLLSH